MHRTSSAARQNSFGGAEEELVEFQSRTRLVAKTNRSQSGEEGLSMLRLCLANSLQIIRNSCAIGMICSDLQRLGKILGKFSAKEVCRGSVNPYKFSFAEERASSAKKTLQTLTNPANSNLQCRVSIRVVKDLQ